MPKKKQSKRNGFNTQKIFKYVRMGALALPAASIAMQPWSVPDKIRFATKYYFGWDTQTNTFNLGDLARGWGPYLTSIAVTYGIPKVAGMIRGF